MKRASALVLVVVAGIMAMALGGEKPASVAPASEPADAVTRFYDVRDLVVNIPDFTSPGLTYGGDKSQGTLGGGGQLFAGGGQLIERSGPTRQELLEQLIKNITDAVDPGSWRDTGGSVGTIRESREEVLMVVQTAGNQKNVEDFLAQYRRLFCPEPVRIRAHWIVAKRSDFAADLKPVTNFRPAAAQGGLHDDGRASSAILEIEESALNRLAGVTHYRGEVLCSSGQSVYVMSSGQRWQIPAGSASSEPGSPPAESTSAQSGGLILDVTNLLSADRTSIILTIRNQWNNATQDTAAAATTQPASAPSTPPARADAAAANKSGSAFHDIETTVRLPLGKTILIGGITLDPASPLTGAASRREVGNEAVQLYLFVEATAQ